MTESQFCGKGKLWSNPAALNSRKGDLMPLPHEKVNIGMAGIGKCPGSSEKEKKQTRHDRSSCWKQHLRTEQPLSQPQRNGFKTDTNDLTWQGEHAGERVLWYQPQNSPRNLTETENTPNFSSERLPWNAEGTILVENDFVVHQISQAIDSLQRPGRKQLSCHSRFKWGGLKDGEETHRGRTSSSLVMHSNWRLRQEVTSYLLYLGYIENVCFNVKKIKALDLALYLNYFINYDTINTINEI